MILSFIVKIDLLLVFLWDFDGNVVKSGIFLLRKKSFWNLNLMHMYLEVLFNLICKQFIDYKFN